MTMMSDNYTPVSKHHPVVEHFLAEDCQDGACKHFTLLDDGCPLVPMTVCASDGCREPYDDGDLVLVTQWPCQPYLDDLDDAALDEFDVVPASPATEARTP
jgi:hypothetical protein